MSRFRRSETEEWKKSRKKKAGRGSEIEMTSCRYYRRRRTGYIYKYIYIDALMCVCALSVYLHSASWTTRYDGGGGGDRLLQNYWNSAREEDCCSSTWCMYIYIYGYRTIIIRSARYNKSPQPSKLPPPQPLRIILHMIIIICNIIYNNNMTYRFVGQWSESKTIRESYVHASRMPYPRIVPGMRLRYSRCIVQCSRYCLYGFIDDIIYILWFTALLFGKEKSQRTHMWYIYIFIHR